MIRVYILTLVTILLLPTHLLAQEYRTLSPENVWLLETDEGDIYIEFAPQFAPGHVERIKQITQAGHYDDVSFYRVIEGFVAQAGFNNDPPMKVFKTPKLKLESPVSLEEFPFTTVQNDDLFVNETGFSDGFAMGRTKEAAESWLLHCPGTVAMARNNEANSATTEFYIVIGQAPRYLDNIMTVFGRVIYGMDVVQSINRGDAKNNGLFKNNENQTVIQRATLLSAVPEAQRPTISVEHTHGEAFEAKLSSRKNRTHAFFFKKPPLVLDVCQVPLSVELIAPQN